MKQRLRVTFKVAGVTYRATGTVVILDGDGLGRVEVEETEPREAIDDEDMVDLAIAALERAAWLLHDQRNERE